jgi:hypothetical protein
MNAQKWLIIIVIYIASSIASYGIHFAHLQAQSNPYFKEQFYKKDMKVSALLSVAGPLSLVAALTMTGFAEHGIKLK